MGDPAGIGPEIILKGLQDPAVLERMTPVVIGSFDVLEERRALVPDAPTLRRIEKPSEVIPDLDGIHVIDPNPLGSQTCLPGQVNAVTGECSYRYIERATRLVMNGQADGIVTGPINKAALNLAGRKFQGHTEILAKLTHAEGVALMLVRDHLRISHVTTHMAVSEVPSSLTVQRIGYVIGLTEMAVKRLGVANPRIGVLALNPHAGESGLFGREEIDTIRPAIERARRFNIRCEGPLVPDATFPLLMGGRYDALVAMYHDQGHVPFKALNFHFDGSNQMWSSVRGVNVTLGLPIVRTSVDHGTALDEAGKGTARPDSLVDAILLAAQLVA